MLILSLIIYFTIVYCIVKFGHAFAVSKSEEALFLKYEKNEPGYSKEARTLMRNAGYKV